MTHDASVSFVVRLLAVFTPSPSAYERLVDDPRKPLVFAAEIRMWGLPERSNS